MSVPVVEVIRSGVVECVHHGSVVVLDPSGAVVLSLGEVDTPILPRSSSKPLQATAMLRCGFEPVSTEECAISAASHEGEREHLRVVQGLLDRSGLTADHLQCPPAYPGHELTRVEVMAAGFEQSPLFMNCSGKHAAMLATCLAADFPLETYTQPSHPLQVAVTATVRELTGAPESDLAVDGCGLPIVPASLTGLARSFATLVTAEPGTHERSVADAMRAHPVLISGTGKADAVLMGAAPGLLAKSGADGVFVGALPSGWAVAFRIADGGDRARLPLAATLLATVVDTPGIHDLTTTGVFGGGRRVGQVQVSDAVGRAAQAGRAIAR